MKSPELLFLEEVIIKHVPEIVELKFGCKVLYEKNIYTIYREYLKDQYKATDKKHTEISLNAQTFGIEILGRDIQLADVMIALSKKIDTHGYEMTLLRFNSTLEIRQNVLTYPGLEVQDTGNKCVWDLTKPLHLQSPSTISSLTELLKSE